MAEAVYRAVSDQEQVAWVDRNDQLLGPMARAQLRENGLIGRCTYILLFNSAGLLCVHKRSSIKALYPSYWDMAAGGMVQYGEDYRVSAERELAEELGITDAELFDHGHFFFDSEQSRLWCRVYSAVSDAPLRLQPEEVVAARFISVEQALAELEQLPYCPDSLQALELYLASVEGLAPARRVSRI